jgi:UDP-2,3-diacylglucosamine hydrolase
MTNIIIADLHLKNDISKFKNFCETIAINYDNLFILGDLFDLYLGDDLIEKYYLDVVNTLKNLSKNSNIFIMAGNRDFLISNKFAKKSGAKLLTEPYLLSDFVLMHGDYLVRADKKYQIFKITIQNQLSKFILNNLPRSWREKLAKNIQTKTKQSKSKKLLDIMDVDDKFTDKFMQKYPHKALIHGHTHRPQIHTRKTYKRYVLGSWDKSPNAFEIKNNKITRLEF